MSVEFQAMAAMAIVISATFRRKFVKLHVPLADGDIDLNRPRPLGHPLHRQILHRRDSIRAAAQ